MSALPSHRHCFRFGFSDSVIEVEAKSVTSSTEPTLREWKNSLLKAPQLVEAGVRSILCINIVQEDDQIVLTDDSATLNFTRSSEQACDKACNEENLRKKAKDVSFRVTIAPDPFAQLPEQWASIAGAPCPPGLSAADIDRLTCDLAGDYPLHNISLPEPIKRMFLWASEWRWRRYLFKLGGVSGYDSEEGLDLNGWIIFGVYDDMACGLDTPPDFHSEAGALWVIDCRIDQPSHGSVLYLHEKDEPHFVCSSASIFASNFERFVGSTMKTIQDKLVEARDAGDPNDEGKEEYKLLRGRGNDNPVRVYFSQGCPRKDDVAWTSYSHVLQLIQGTTESNHSGISTGS